jgi:hypothetical protein
MILKTDSLQLSKKRVLSYKNTFKTENTILECKDSKIKEDDFKRLSQGVKNAEIYSNDNCIRYDFEE